MNKVDLHLHTNLSDGLISPEETIKRAKQNDCQIISLTDHDLLRGYNEFASKYDIDIIPGIEFNTAVSNLHLLGYGVKNIETVNDVMFGLKKANEEVCLEVIELLQKDGFVISADLLREYLQSINLDYTILDKRKLVKYLMYMGYSSSIVETYNALIGKNQKYYVPNIKIPPEKIIELIGKCGGYTVLAHPNTITDDRELLIQILTDLKSIGLFGLEVVNDKMKLYDTQFYQRLAKEYDLIETYGSDFHDPECDTIGIEISEYNYEKIHDAMVLRRKI